MRKLIEFPHHCRLPFGVATRLRLTHTVLRAPLPACAPWGSFRTVSTAWIWLHSNLLFWILHRGRHPLIHTASSPWRTRHFINWHACPKSETVEQTTIFVFVRTIIMKYRGPPYSVLPIAATRC